MQLFTHIYQLKLIPPTGLYKNSIDEILIRAILSQFNTWEDINVLYITERAEKNKFLKNILASDDKVREMLHKVF